MHIYGTVMFKQNGFTSMHLSGNYSTVLLLLL